MTDALEDRSNSQTPGEGYGGLLEGIGPVASELSLIALVSPATSRALLAVAGCCARMRTAWVGVNPGFLFFSILRVSGMRKSELRTRACPCPTIRPPGRVIP
jgi:hypothetical protein